AARPACECRRGAGRSDSDLLAERATVCPRHRGRPSRRTRRKFGQRGQAVNRQEFVETYGFELDGFQERALDALDSGRSVLVAAPTGSGKTLVAEYAVAKALDDGAKAFYTTPLKALSNQKFGALVRRHGPA